MSFCLRIALYWKNDKSGTHNNWKTFQKLQCRFLPKKNKEKIPPYYQVKSFIISVSLLSLSYITANLKDSLLLGEFKSLTNLLSFISWLCALTWTDNHLWFFSFYYWLQDNQETLRTDKVISSLCCLIQFLKKIHTTVLTSQY